MVANRNRVRSPPKSCWIISDEAYEEFAYERPHIYAYGLAPERVFAVYSFSKAFGIPGSRCGYAVGPMKEMAIVRKVTTHISYGSPMASQIAACRLLSRGGDAWVSEARRQYEEVGSLAAERLHEPTPEGAHYLFVDIAEVLDSSGLAPFLRACVSRGVLVTPGTLFGPYPTFIRICFTCLPPEAVLRGIEVLARLLGR